MSKLPASRYEMRRAGYTFLNCGTCRSCGAPIEWWLTNNKKKIPMNVVEDDDMECLAHFVTCPDADRHRTKTATPATQNQPAPDSSKTPGGGVHNGSATPTSQTQAFERELKIMIQQSGAIAAVLAFDASCIVAWKRGAMPEDARNSLIAAANYTRGQMQAEARANAENGRRR